MEPTTALTILGAAFGSAKVLEKMLGPTADYLGEGLKDWTTKGCENLGRIFEKARLRLGARIEEPGAIPPRVLKEVLREGPFCEDAFWAEYFGGVLASSRSDVSRDDRGARFAALLGRMSTYEIRGHYLFYRLFKTLFNGSVHTVNTADGQRALRMFLPSLAFAQGMDMGPSESFDILLGHTLVGLISEALLGEAYQYGPVEHLRKNRWPDAPEAGLVIQPSSLGAELFLWAHGMGHTSTGAFLHAETVLSSNIALQIAPGIRGVEQDGPHLDEILREEAAVTSAQAQQDSSAWTDGA